MKTLVTMAVLAGAMVAASGAARAQSVVVLIDGNRLATVDVKRLAAGAPVKVSGLPGRLLGMDVRPADGKLYGLFEDGTVAVLDPATGVATARVKLEAMLPAGVAATVDFNPAADRLRIIGSDGTNLRANVDDGKVVRDGALKFAEADASAGTAPRVVAGAYTNAYKGAKETVLYDVDGRGTLLRQAPPNDGILNTVGPLGVADMAVAFDIVAADAGASEGWLMAGPVLYRVDLASGKASSVGTVKGVQAAKDIAILPAR